MGTPTSGDRHVPTDGAGYHRQRRRSRTSIADRLTFEVFDMLPDSFALLPDESQWLMALMADELAGIFNDD